MYLPSNTWIHAGTRRCLPFCVVLLNCCAYHSGQGSGQGRGQGREDVHCSLVITRKIVLCRRPQPAPLPRLLILRLLPGSGQNTNIYWDSRSCCFQGVLIERERVESESCNLALPANIKLGFRIRYPSCSSKSPGFIFKMVKIFIANLTDECTNDDLQTLFSQYERSTITILPF